MGQKGAVLEPAHDQFAEILAAYVPVMEIADIRHPPGDPAHGHVQTGPHYALDTVNLLAEQNPRADLVYLMGGDSLRDLPTWHRPADFVAACHSIGVMCRPGDAIDLSALEKMLPGLTDKVRFMDAPLLDLAAHEIRARVAEGRPFRYFLPPGVYTYIVEYHLYR